MAARVNQIQRITIHVDVAVSRERICNNTATRAGRRALISVWLQKSSSLRIVGPNSELIVTRDRVAARSAVELGVDGAARIAGIAPRKCGHRYAPSIGPGCAGHRPALSDGGADVALA